METWLHALKEVIPEKQILTSVADLYSYSFDASFGEYMPEVVVQAKTVAEIQHIMRTANTFKVPVTPRGQGTCLSGGPLPVEGGIVLDMSQYPVSIEVMPDDSIAVVSASALTADINAAAEAYGFMYPPDPSSAHVSTIGGNLAENSGGPRGLKYGVTRDYVLGLEVVTPEGEVIETGGRTIKNVTGYNLTHLFIGSEGTLGVITKAVLKLVPKPQASTTIMASFNDIRQAGKAISKTLTSHILPAKMEFIDQACIIAVENYQPSGFSTDVAAVLIIELDGHPAAIVQEAQTVKDIMTSIGAIEVVMPETASEAAAIWHARKQVSPAIAKIKPTKVSEDATVPRSKIPEMITRLQEIKEKYQINLVVFGHIGDGNLHPNILCDKRDEAEMIRVEQAIGEIFSAAIELGGTLSGEHGIGTMKAPFLGAEFTEIEIALMKQVKASFDPLNIMNPGKIFPKKDQKLVLRNG